MNFLDVFVEIELLLEGLITELAGESLQFNLRLMWQGWNFFFFKKTISDFIITDLCEHRLRSLNIFIIFMNLWKNFHLR